MTPEQLAWLEEDLRGTRADWKICFMHHPLYSTATTHGPSLDLRQVLEPIFIRYQVDLVFAGHEHSYERFVPQHGITYIVAGASAKLRPGSVRGGKQTAARYDRDHSFVLVEIDGNQLWFRAIDRRGAVVDSGLIARARASQ
jgi:3',5'-cyclic AMP phosphodiesterase CpdA